MTSKKIIAFMLTICMLLTCLPAFAATVTLGDIVIPEEGVSVSATRTIWESFVADTSARDVLIILNKDSSAKFPNRAVANHYNGLSLSFTVSFHNEAVAEGMPETFTVVDAPACYTRVDGYGNFALGVTPADLIACSPELSELTDVDFSYTGQETPFSISNMRIYTGDWVCETIDTGVFTEGTLFMSYKGFANYPSTWQVDTSDNYTGIWYPGTVTNDGPSQFFVPEKTADYKVYAQIITNQGSLADRSVHIEINGKELEFNPANVSDTTKLPTGMLPAWVPETNATTVTLTKDELTRVQIMFKKIYSRVVSLAFIPVDDYATVSAALDASPSTRVLGPNDMVAVSVPAYHPDFATEAINVTVEGVDVSVKAGKASKNVNGEGYIAATSMRVSGFPTRVLPETNTFPTYHTVLDAIAQYVSDNQTSTALVPIAGITNGLLPSIAVLVNGKLATDLDWYEIKEGDAITLEAKDRKDLFDPTPIKGFRAIDTNQEGLIEAMGTPTSGTGAHPDGKIKLCLNLANTTNALGAFATALDETGLKDCYLVGVLTLRKDNSNFAISNNGGSNWTNLTGKVYLENVPIVGYDISPNATRVDLVTGGNFEFNAKDPRYKDPNGNTATDADGKTLVKPYAFFGDNYLYNWSNVYLVNSSTDTSLKAVKSKDMYTLTTGGMHVVDVVIATYAEDGKTVTGTTTMKEQVVMFNDPLEIPVAANQKAFVWGTKIYEGTTMMPKVAPLVGSNFAN